MVVVMWSAGRMLAGLAFALVATLAVQAAPAEAQPAPPVIGCSWAPVSSAVELVKEVEDDGEADDTAEAEAKIAGSVPLPAGMRRSDQRGLASVATIGRDRAVEIAFGALPDAGARRIEEVELEAEQGYVVWEVETILRSPDPSPNRIAEVVVDAGNGDVLAIECEAEDD